MEDIVRRSQSPPQSSNLHLDALVREVLQNLGISNHKCAPGPSDCPDTTPDDSVQRNNQTTNQFTDRKNRLIAGMISQFRTLVQLATTAPSDGATREMAAAHGLRLEAETQTLV